MTRVAIDALSAHGGGGVTYLDGLLTYLPAVWPDSALLVLASDGNLQRFGSAIVSTKVMGFKFATVAHRVLWEQTRLPGWMKQQGTDLLLAPGNIGPVARPCRFVLVVQNIEPLVPVSRDIPVAFRTKLLLLRALTVASIRKAKAVITVSEYARQLIYEVCGPHIPEVTVIHHGRPDDAEQVVSANAAALRAARGIRQHYVLAVSSIKANKNFPRLIAAFAAANLEGYDLVIAGPSEHPWAAQACAAEIRRHGLEGRVILIGGVDRSTLRACYEAATAFAFPSEVESFGLPVLEAMAYGVPVVASDIGPLREIGGQAGVYFNPRDVDEMAAAIKRVVCDEGLRRGLIAAGRERSRLFAWSQTARQTRDVLTAAAGAATRSSGPQ